MNLDGGILYGGLFAFLLTVAGIPALRRPALRIGLVDRPNRRKRHHGAVPLTGGVALLFAFVVAARVTPVDWLVYWSLPIGVVVLSLLGLLDDFLAISAWTRLVMQVFVSVAMVVTGLQVGSLGDLFGFGPLGLGWFAIPFTVLCVAFMINAINMIDGMDGLAGLVTLLAGLGMMVLAFSAGLEQKAGIAALLVGGVSGFLLFNLRSPWARRAHAFLGDSGSMVLGFVLAWLAVAITQPVSTGVAPVSVALLLLLPAADTLAVFFRRLRRGRSPFAPDCTHLHHILQRAGFSVSSVVAIIGLNQVALVGFALAAHFGGVGEAAQFAVASGAFIAYLSFLLNARLFLRVMGRIRRRRATTARLNAETG